MSIDGRNALKANVNSIESARVVMTSTREMTIPLRSTIMLQMKPKSMELGDIDYLFEPLIRENLVIELKRSTTGDYSRRVQVWDQMLGLAIMMQAMEKAKNVQEIQGNE
jgi:hypothetical protein